MNVPYQRVAWAGALCEMLGLIPYTNSLVGLVAWETAEGGGFGNEAENNALNTTEPFDGSFPINSVGVQSYRTARDGLLATVATITMSPYGGIVEALRAGATPWQIAEEIGASPWGTPGSLVLACIPQARGAVASFYQNGAGQVFYQEANGDIYEKWTHGGETYAKGVAENLKASIPAAWIIPDPEGHWLNRFGPNVIAAA